MTNDVLERCRSAGFPLAGVCEALPIDKPDAYRAWIAAGKHGEMSYLARNVELRVDPRIFVSDARSIICVGDRYHVPKRGRGPTTTEASEAFAEPTGRIARYARGDDYHDIVKKRLHSICDDLRERYPDHAFRACVDTAPIMEREHAMRAGLGSIGKHTLLIERGVGSYLLLGEIVTTLALTPSTPVQDDPCGACTRCIDACPTEAITPWSVDATRCISYLTIEHRTPIEETFHEAMDDWIFGCDICQEVCPHNQPAWSKSDREANPAYAGRRDSLPLHEVLAWSEEDRRAAFRKSALKRAKLDMIKRNARIALSNAVDSSGWKETEPPTDAGSSA